MSSISPPKLKPKDIAMVSHSDHPSTRNGFISQVLETRLRKEKNYANPEHFEFTDKTPWLEGAPLVEGMHVPSNTMALILEGPSLLNGTDWFYRIFTVDITTCWMPASKLVYFTRLEDNNHDKSE